MGVFQHTLTVMNRITQSLHAQRRARQDERLRLKSIYILYNNCLFC